MSESASNDIGRLKISKNPITQVSVDKEKIEIKKKHPQIEEAILNHFARNNVASRLKLNKRQQEKEYAEKAAYIDEKTKLHNNKWFREQLEIKMSEAKRYGRPFVLIGFDMDNFKWINDRYGHPVGDKILKIFKLIKTRKEEPICRTGGDEFHIMINTKNERDIQIFTSRLSKLAIDLSRDILEKEMPLPNSPVADIFNEISLSIGIAKFNHSMSSEDLIAAADSAMYHAKATGKNKIFYADKTSDKNNATFKEIPKINIQEKQGLTI
jgi:diguanylate cyclase (GGDEF)-like protein